MLVDAEDAVDATEDAEAERRLEAEAEVDATDCKADVVKAGRFEDGEPAD